MAKILQIGNYPPPVCGWSIQTKLIVEEIRRRGVVCDVLNLSENRTIKSREYVDVQGGFDYLSKVIRFAVRGYRFQVHVNGQSEKGYILAVVAAIVGRLVGRPVVLSWHGGLQQKYFPRVEGCWARRALQLLFLLSEKISCDHAAVKQAIELYGVKPTRVAAIPCFSVQNLTFLQVQLAAEIEEFFNRRNIVFFCYVSFRPEYKLSVLRVAMRQFRQRHPKAGFVWLGFPSKELPAAARFVSDWIPEERRSLLLLGNLDHDEFLTIMSRCFAVIRTPACDGVSASVLEALALGIPVIASENHHRPRHVITYREEDAEDLCAKLVDLTERYSEIKQETCLDSADDNVIRTVDWLLDCLVPANEKIRTSLVHVG